MIMVSDFQCPYCKQWHDASFAQLVRDYVATGKVRLAFINFPLRAHPNAFPAAEVAMCAGLQGKFWQMHDALFASQDRWAPRFPVLPTLDSVAASIGVDTQAVNACVTAHVPDATIQADYDRGERAGVNSTPTVIIDRHLLVGVQPTANYRQALDAALAH
jgi:protein-disulfide isomerase